MKNILMVVILAAVLFSCSDSAKSTNTEETIPTNRLDAITSLDDFEDTLVVRDSTAK